MVKLWGKWVGTRKIKICRYRFILVTLLKFRFILGKSLKLTFFTLKLTFFTPQLLIIKSGLETRESIQNTLVSKCILGKRLFCDNEFQWLFVCLVCFFCVLLWFFFTISSSMQIFLILILEFNSILSVQLRD